MGNLKKDLNPSLNEVTGLPIPYSYELQLHEYETDPYFLQLSQNMASDCLFTFVFFPRISLFCTENCSEH